MDTSALLWAYMFNSTSSSNLGVIDLSFSFFVQYIERFTPKKLRGKVLYRYAKTRGLLEKWSPEYGSCWSQAGLVESGSPLQRGHGQESTTAALPTP